jgi:dienelactone hydrolase
LSRLVTYVILFHHALGLTSGVEAFAQELRESGHDVVVPDLFEGATFTSLDDGVAHVESVGVENLLEAGVTLAADHPAEVVYAGFSLGGLIAHRLAQTRPGAMGALLYHYGDVPVEMFGESWPSGVPVQFHIAQHDEWREAGVVEDFVAGVESIAAAELFDYPGSAHLFTDSSLPEFAARAAALVMERTLLFLE